MKTTTCPSCGSVFEIQGHAYKYCSSCRQRVQDLVRKGLSDTEISAITGMKRATVSTYRYVANHGSRWDKLNYKNVVSSLAGQFDYRGKLEAMKAKITRRTGITDFASPEGQAILNMINIKCDAEQVHCQRPGCQDTAELWGMRRDGDEGSAED